MPVEPFVDNTMRTDSPAQRAVAITPSDSVDIVFTPALQASLSVRALFVGGAGNVAVITSGGDTVTFTGVAAGSILPVRCARVLLSGTTATAIVALA